MSVLSNLFVCILTLSLIFLNTATAQQAESSLTESMREALQKEIHDYILSHPEIVYQALERLQEQQVKQQKVRRETVITELKKRIETDSMIPVSGNQQGDVTIIEFFDYNCGYCKSVVDILSTRMAADGQLRVAFIEFPILGKASVYAARVALAAAKQGRYEAFHFALMRNRGRLNREVVRSHAEQIGLDWAQVERDIKTPEITQAIERNQALAQNLGISGTPVFIIGDELVPGAITEITLKSLISKARES